MGVPDMHVIDSITSELANRLQFTPDGKRALISSLRNGDLSIFDVATLKELNRINIGH